MKQKAIIVDIDGTLAHMNGRSPYDYTQVHLDLVDPIIRDMVARYYETHRVFVLSGRKAECYQSTQQWLIDNQVMHNVLYMRKDDDNREDSVVKSEIFYNEIFPKYDVDFVLDDRDRVVQMWRDIGLKCLQVAPGNF